MEETTTIIKRQWAKQYNVKPKTITTHLYYLGINPNNATPLDIQILKEDMEEYIERKNKLWQLYRLEEELKKELNKEDYFKNMDLMQQMDILNKNMINFCKEHKEFRSYIKHFVRERGKWGYKGNYIPLMAKNFNIMYDSYE